MTTRFLRRREAAAYIRERGVPCSPLTLAKWASIGGGPPFYKASRTPLYAPGDLDRWIAHRLGPLRASTSALADSENHGAMTE